MQDVNAASRAFVREMRLLTARRDSVSLHQAVLQMRQWLENNPNDTVIGTALEEFDILEEAAQIVEQKNNATKSRVEIPEIAGRA